MDPTSQPPPPPLPTSWEEKVAAFERRLRQLNHRRIVGVRYCEIDYQSDVAAWNYRPEHDSLDFGLALELEDGEHFFVEWGSQFTKHCLCLVPSEHWECEKVLDVTQSSRWTELIGVEVIATQLFWRETGGHDVEDHSHYPQDLGLTFANGRQVYISALEIREENFAWGSRDHITLFFDHEVAKQYKIGPWA